MRCDTCEEIFRNCIPIDPTKQYEQFVSLYAGVHQPSADRLRYSQKQGCSICNRLYDSLPSQLKKNLQRLDHPDGFSRFELFNPASHGKKLTLALTFPGASDQRHGISDGDSGRYLDRGITFYLHPVSGPIDNQISYSASRIDFSTGSTTSLDLINVWVRHCISNHVHCRRAVSKSRYIPTRLIEVGTSAEPSLKLAIRSDGPAKTEYTTLSHCWGSTSFKTLLQSNLEDMRRSIPICELPQTFRDAIDVTRALGINYIWIDSLCIMQDSVQDWEQEASTMGDVYANTYLNIAATKSFDSKQGLFTTRNPVDFVAWDYLVNIEHANGISQAYFIDDESYWTSRVEDAPLIRRAWVVQERLLASRCAHFAHDQVLWECSELAASEEFPDGLPFRKAENFKLSIPNTLRLNLTTTDPKEPNSHRMIWGQIIQRYSQGKLTRGSDKLIAISGIAKRVYEILRSPYIAGLWLCSMATDILWRTEFWGQSRRSTSYIAPSWSWASIEGPVLPGSSWIRGEEIIKVVDFSVTPAAHDSYAQLRSAWLRLSGRLYPARIIADMGSTEIKFSEEFEPRHNRVTPDEIPTIPAGQSQLVINVFVLPVVQCGDKASPSRVGLVLLPAPHMPQGVYTRFGQFTSTYISQPTKMLGMEADGILQSNDWYEQDRSRELTICIL